MDMFFLFVLNMYIYISIYMWDSIWVIGSWTMIIRTIFTECPQPETGLAFMARIFGVPCDRRNIHAAKLYQFRLRRATGF